MALIHSLAALLQRSKAWSIVVWKDSEECKVDATPQDPSRGGDHRVSRPSLPLSDAFGRLDALVAVGLPAMRNRHNLRSTLTFGSRQKCQCWCIHCSCFLW